MKARPRSPRRSGSAPEFFSQEVFEAERFHLNLNPPKDRPLVVVCGGLEHSTPGYAIHRPTFPFYVIDYVVRGRGTVRLQNRPHQLQPGSLYSYGPGISLDIESDPAAPLVKYFTAFVGTQALGLLRSCKLPPSTVAQVFPPTELEEVFDELINSGLKHSRYTAKMCAVLLQYLALKILEARAPHQAGGNLSFTTYQQCCDHIQQHCVRLTNLEQLARECHVDAAYLRRLFKRYDHQSPSQFLLRLKLNLAAEWLRQPGATARQASEKAGFSDSVLFARAFKGCFGVSPEEFRRLR